MLKIAVVGSLAPNSFVFCFSQRDFISQNLRFRRVWYIHTCIYNYHPTISTSLFRASDLITRDIAKYEIENNYEAIKGLLIRCNQFIFLSSIILILGTLLTGYIWWKDYSISFTETLWMGFLLLPLISLGAIRAAALRGLHYVVLGQLPDTLLRNLLLCAGILIFYLLKVQLTPYLGMLIHVIAAACTFLYNRLCIFKTKALK